MSMAYPFLSISPSQLEFLFDANQELKSVLTFRGCQEGVRIAFKIKITNSERFVVCPPFGIVEPQSTRYVRVYLKAPARYEDSLKFCNDRFLVQSIQVNEGFEEKQITSDLFRTRERQEVKLKVLVSAPLAHSTILEQEIRTIASKQGVEGHRAVLRKFSELLLAKGVISQSQVALAFSAVGEIFQNLNPTSKESEEEIEKNLQRFLSRGSSEGGRSNANTSSQSVQPKQYNSSSWAADYRPSNLPSRASVPVKEASREQNLKSHYSASEASIRNGSEGSARNGGNRLSSGLRSNLSTASSEGRVSEDRRSSAHPAVTRLNLSHHTRSSLLDDMPPESSSLEEAERPEELEPSAYEAFAPSPEGPNSSRFGDEDDTKGDSTPGKSTAQPAQAAPVEPPVNAELQDPELLKRLQERRQHNEVLANEAQQHPSAPTSPLADHHDSNANKAKERKPGTDSLGRDFSLMIDRLATPAIRKQKLPQQPRTINHPAKPTEPSATSARDMTAGDEKDKGTETGLAGNTKRGVFIPSGNTKQKADMFR